MSELLESGTVGLTTLRTLNEQRKQIVTNWDASGLLEGLNGMKKSNIAILLENQASYMLNEATLDASAGRFDTVAFPMVRRIFSRLLANEIVSVQPLALPTGLIFYMDARVSNTAHVAPKNTANSQAGPTFSNNSGYERFYDNRGYDFSRGTPTSESGTTMILTSGLTTDGLFSTAITLSTNFDISTNISSASLRIVAKSAVTYGSTTVVAINANIPYYMQKQTWGVDLFDSRMPNVVIDVRPAGVYGSSFNPLLLNSVWCVPVYEYYADLEANSSMGELTIRFSSVTVNATTRKMRAHWTPELAQDLEAYHSIDAEAELTALLSEEVAAEIDREIIKDLIQQAMFEARWDYAGLANSSNFFGTQKDWNQTLITRINEISAQIHKATLRGGANWIICSAEAGAIFDDLEYFHVDSSASPETEKYNLGIEKIGNLGNRYMVYKDPYMPSNIILLGHKGTSFLEAGYVYAPYIPLQLTGVITDPNDFTPRKGLMTRYAKKMINNRFYGVIRIDNINTYTAVY